MAALRCWKVNFFASFAQIGGQINTGLCYQKGEGRREKKDQRRPVKSKRGKKDKERKRKNKNEK